MSTASRNFYKFLLISLVTCIFIIFFTSRTYDFKFDQQHQTVNGNAKNDNNNSTNKINKPKWLLNNLIDLTSNLKNVRKDKKSLQPFDLLLATPTRTNAPTDYEDHYATENFFYGMIGGIVMEMGALDGTYPKGHSMSYAFTKFGWKRILIEGNPVHKKKLSEHKDGIAVNAVVCDQRRKVHYVNRKTISGIIEFMPIKFLKDSHPMIHKAYKSHDGPLKPEDWNVVSHLVYEVDCLPLSEILSYIRVQHINFFILDVEGAEGAILQSIDFDSIMFDVIVIENVLQRPKGYKEGITKFLKPLGYEAIVELGRNTWYKNINFAPSSRKHENNY